METVYDIMCYYYDGEGGRWNDSEGYPLTKSLEKAKKLIHDYYDPADDDYELSEEDGLPIALTTHGKYGYTKIYIQPRELED
jgi:hypothetical protein